MVEAGGFLEAVENTPQLPMCCQAINEKQLQAGPCDAHTLLLERGHSLLGVSSPPQAGWEGIASASGRLDFESLP